MCTCGMSCRQHCVSADCCWSLSASEGGTGTAFFLWVDPSMLYRPIPIPSSHWFWCWCTEEQSEKDQDFWSLWASEEGIFKQLSFLVWGKLSLVDPLVPWMLKSGQSVIRTWVLKYGVSQKSSFKILGDPSAMVCVPTLRDFPFALSHHKNSTRSAGGSQRRSEHSPVLTGHPRF